MEKEEDTANTEGMFAKTFTHLRPVSTDFSDTLLAATFLLQSQHSNSVLLGTPQ